MLSDKQFRDLLAEHVTDDRAKRALRDDQTQARLNEVRADNCVWELEDKLMEMGAKV